MTPHKPQPGLAGFEALRRMLVIGATLGTLAIVVFFVMTLVVTVPMLAKASDEAVLRFLAAWVPVPIYLWAIWQARVLFARLPPVHEQGYAILSRGLIRIGVALSVTSVWSGVVGFYLAISFNEGANARFISTVVPQLALCLIGLALAAVGALLRRSAAMIAENATLKEQLEGFI